MKIKTISLWQPWASAIALGIKTIETRSWKTWHRGPIAIHAAQKHTVELAHIADQLFEEHVEFRVAFRNHIGFHTLPFGCVVAVAELVECVRTDTINPLSPIERALGDYTPGRYGWILRNVIPLAAPIPLKARQGLFTAELDVPNPCPSVFIRG